MMSALLRILHYHELQKFKALINAIVGCTPVDGAVIATVLNNFQITGLVQALMSVEKQWSSYGTTRFVDRLLRNECRGMGKIISRATKAR